MKYGNCIKRLEKNPISPADIQRCKYKAEINSFHPFISCACVYILNSAVEKQSDKNKSRLGNNTMRAYPSYITNISTVEE